MFHPKQILQNSILTRILRPLTYKGLPGSYIDEQTTDQLKDKLLNAKYELKHILPRSNLRIYHTEDLGYGYRGRLPLRVLSDLIFTDRVPSNIQVKTVYKYGNIFACVKSTDINMNAVLSCSSYVVVDSELNIWNIEIGGITSPNLMYYSYELDGLYHPVSSLSRLTGLKTIDLTHTDFESLDHI